MARFFISIRRLSIHSDIQGLSLTFETGQSLSFAIIADELRLRQVVFNLLSNAIKFTFNGYCRLNVVTKGGKKNRYQLTIAVEDSGVGIPKEQQNDVFEPFKQVGERLQHKEGAGLGLAISRQLVHLMGGELVLSSPVNTSPPDGQGVGSRFCFTIEAEKVQVDKTVNALEGIRQVVGYAHAGPANEPIRILIVSETLEQRCLQHGFKGFILKPFVTSNLLQLIAGLLPITLIYHEAEEQERGDFSEIEIPTVEVIAKLSESLSKGDIEGILQNAEAIGELENGKYHIFSQTVRSLANDFKFSELEKLISSKENADD